MGWKVIHLTKPCKIKIKHENLLLSFYEDENEMKVIIKDIDFILFDNTQFSITGKVLELLSKNNIATLFIDEEFTPCGIYTPYYQHSTMTEIAHIQISITKEYKKKVWQNIIKSKLTNNAKVLELCQNKDYILLEKLATKVQIYDKNNDEAQGARIYWKTLFHNPHFRREQGAKDIYNVMLNYGYAIIRATMARSVSASGLIPIFGIWHQNKYNAFNLVDDLIEPFRAFVDIHIKILRREFEAKLFLDVDLKRKIVSLLHFECVNINNGTTNLLKAIEIFVIHYKKAMIDDDTDLIKYPTINEKYFKYECL